MQRQFRVVFSGRIRDGLKQEHVRAAVAQRLSAGSAQVDRIFCGKRVVLKNGLQEEDARNYVGRLERLGMVVSMEPMPPVVPEADPVTITPFNTPVTQLTEPRERAPVATVVPSRSLEDSWLTSSSFADLARTQFNLSRAEALLNGYDASSVPEPEEMMAPVAVAAKEVPASQVAANEQVVVPLRAAKPHVAATETGPVSTLVLNGTFSCGHCGVMHQVNATIVIPHGEAQAPQQELVH